MLGNDRLATGCGCRHKDRVSPVYRLDRLILEAVELERPNGYQSSARLCRR